ncbi:hypothetical protein HMPREF1121_00634 [Porphyromonas sp. KLE 1280]|nr:hypothetical protein HMPREF1121_00634 [Porphyromonas sp. KLE 1280]
MQPHTQIAIHRIDYFLIFAIVYKHTFNKGGHNIRHQLTEKNLINEQYFLKNRTALLQQQGRAAHTKYRDTGIIFSSNGLPRRSLLLSPCN